MDFKVLDRIEQVNDQESFVMARRLAREEGLFVGGSTGSAVAVAARIAKELGPEKKIVVIAPDSGSRYISKMYSDEWMKDNGFLNPAPAEGSLQDLLSRKKKALYTCRPGESINSVIARLKEFAISQMPAMDKNGKLLGIIHEVDLLEAVVYGNKKVDEPLDELIKPAHDLLTEDASLEELRAVFDRDNIALIKDSKGMLTAVVSKIDLIDYTSQSQRATH